MASTAAPSLARSLRRWDLVGVVLNGVIGAGIFGLPSKIFSLTGADSIFAFGACAVCVSMFVLCFAEVASRYSGTGGPYIYARETYGPTVGFTVGWLVWIARLGEHSRCAPGGGCEQHTRDWKAAAPGSIYYRRPLVSRPFKIFVHHVTGLPAVHSVASITRICIHRLRDGRDSCR